MGKLTVENRWDLPVMASDYLGRDKALCREGRRGAGGKLPTVVMSASPEISFSLCSRKKGQCCPCWHLLSFSPHPLLPASYTHKEPAGQGKSLADSAPRTE